MTGSIMLPSHLLAIFLLLLASSMATAISLVRADTNPPAIFAFGDSLSDVGTNNDLPGGFRADHLYYGIDFPGGEPTGRVTNGYNLIDVLAQHMGFPLSPPPYNSTDTDDTYTGVNLASGGSGILWHCKNGTTKMCYTMEEQIERFREIKHDLQKLSGIEAAEELINKSIFTFTCGSNDIFYLLLHDQWTLIFQFDEFVANMTSALKDRIQELYDLGGRKFAIVSIPPLGMTPFPNYVPPIQKLLLGKPEKFNSAERTMMVELSSSLPGMSYSIGNAFDGLLDVINNPEQHGVKNVTSPCCGAMVGCEDKGPLCSNRSEYVFWDILHPTQVMIEYAAEMFYSGNLTYAYPMNLKELVEHETSVGRFEAM